MSSPTHDRSPLDDWPPRHFQALQGKNTSVQFSISAVRKWEGRKCGMGETYSLKSARASSIAFVSSISCKTRHFLTRTTRHSTTLWIASGWSFGFKCCERRVNFVYIINSFMSTVKPLYQDTFIFCPDQVIYVHLCRV